MTEVLVIDPVFAPRLWGGTTLRQWYGDAVPDDTIGEAWVVSGLPDTSGLVSAGPGAGGTLADAWRAGAITGAARTDDFPILCKILDPADWLSVQVHPDDAQAQRLEGEPRGKAECWYVLSAEPGAELIMGHRAADGAELRHALQTGQLMDQLIRTPVHAGSFFMVPAGCVHAVGPGMLVYEVQQSCDITYRLYDFDRVGADGRPRDLHVDRGFEVVAPYDSAASLTAAEPMPIAGGTRQDLVSNDYFTVTHWRVDGAIDLASSDYRIVTVVAGHGRLVDPSGEVVLHRGSSVVIPRGVHTQVLGDIAVITTDPGDALAS